MNKLLKLNEVAMMLSVTPQTLREWDKNGSLKAVIINSRGDRRYRPEDIEEFVKEGK